VITLLLEPAGLRERVKAAAGIAGKYEEL